MSGSIKDYTKYYKFYIPRFDLATWHDYIENNFRSIDAILNNIFSIANYKGEWKNSTTYTTDDVLFIENDGTQYEGKLVKVLENHTTPGSGTFEDYYTNNSDKYSIGLSASDTQIYAQNAQTSATNALTYENLAKDWACKQSTTVDGTYYSARYYANEANSKYLEAKAARDDALTYSTNASNSATAASNYKTAAQDWARKTDGLVDSTDYSSKYYAQQSASSATNAYNYAQSVNPNNLVHIDGNETINNTKTFTGSTIFEDYITKYVITRPLDQKPDGIYLKSSFSSTSSSLGITSGLLFCDNDYIILSGIRGGFMSQTYGDVYLFANSTNGLYSAEIKLEVFNDGTINATAPESTDTISTSSKHIATCGWVNKTGNNIVHLTDTEIITGEKTFTNTTKISYGEPKFNINNTNITKGTAPDSNAHWDIIFNDVDGNKLGYIEQFYSTNKGSSITIAPVKSDSVTETSTTGLVISYLANGDKDVRPTDDNDINLGTASKRWKQLYAATSTINTSDERIKQQINDIPEQVLLAWGEVNFYQFKYNDAVAEKGENARLHIGLIAQRIKTVFESHNLDATKYGLLCYDEWEADEETHTEAGNLYSLRYEECLCMEAAYQRYRANKLEQRLQNIENLLNINNQGEN